MQYYLLINKWIITCIFFKCVTNEIILNGLLQYIIKISMSLSRPELYFLSASFSSQLGDIKLFCRQCDVVFNNDVNFVGNHFHVQYGN